MDRAARLEIANQFIRIISEYGRHFFRYGDRVSRFAFDSKNRVRFIDAYSLRTIYTASRRGSWKGFSQGGTLMYLVKILHGYIVNGTGIGVALQNLGPWRMDLCGGDLWGYGDDMEIVRQRCRELVKEATPE